MKKPKKIRARRVMPGDLYLRKNLETPMPQAGWHFVLPGSDAEVEQAVEQMAEAIAETRNWKGAFYTDCPANVRETYRKDARAALKSLAITARSTGAGGEVGK